jgi:hypothetical protein
MKAMALAASPARPREASQRGDSGRLRIMKRANSAGMPPT